MPIPKFGIQNFTERPKDAEILNPDFTMPKLKMLLWKIILMKNRDIQKDITQLKLNYSVPE